MGAAAILGLNVGCNGSEVIDGGEEYGTPTAEFEVKGRVTNPDGQPVANVEVQMADNADTTATYGSFDVTALDLPHNKQDVHFRDLEGRYADTTTTVDFPRNDFEGGSGNWYIGHATMTVDVELKAN